MEHGDKLNKERARTPHATRTFYMHICSLPTRPAGRRHPLLFPAPALILASLLACFWISATVVAEETAHTLADETQIGNSKDDSNVVSTPEVTFVETVTVASTRSERTLKDTPGTVDVVQRDEIQDLGYSSVGDLIRFSPGVFVEGDLTRLGSGGFNIRGIGGNRVLTQIDGVPAAEQFDFGPFAIHQFSLDVEHLENLEIVRSAGSALYGSDALGGVVSLTTRGPDSYLGGKKSFFGLRAGYEGRSDEISESLAYARRLEDLRFSVVLTHRDSHEFDNQGTVDTEDFTRTTPNPIERRQLNLLTKVTYDLSPGSSLETTVEAYETQSDTEAYSSRTPASPFASAVQDFDARDSQQRQRLSLEQSTVTSRTWADSVLWRLYAQNAETEQRPDELLQSSAGLRSQRLGLLSFDQQTTGLEAEVRKALGSSSRQVISYGLQARHDRFDMNRDRTETFLDTGEPVPTSLVFPTKYFPRSSVEELGAFVQAELELWGGRLRVVPGLRYDRFELSPDSDDRIYLDGNPGTPAPVGVEDEAISPKLGLVLALNEHISAFGQFAAGFRAPPMSAVNNGFTNRAGGYRTLPNPDLQPETSDNIELGMRGSFARGGFSVTAFENRYDDFIETVFLGFNPAELLVEFQPQNLQEVEISGIELSGDFRFKRSWRLRTAFAVTDGEDITTGQPLESIAPSRWVTGLRYDSPAAAARPWGAEFLVTAVSAKDADDLPSDSTQFNSPAYDVVDLAAWLQITDRLRFQLSAWNLTDETYWQWAYVRGQSQDASTLDRYTSPGRSFSLQARMSF